MNAKQTELLKRLEEIVETYISDPILQSKLRESIDPLKVKYVLNELEISKNKPFNDSDKNDIKNIYFNFC